MTILELIKTLKTGSCIEVRYESDNTEILHFWPSHYFEGHCYFGPRERKIVEETEVSSFDFDDEDRILTIYVDHI